MQRLASVNGGILAAPGQGAQRPLIYKSRRRHISPFGLGLVGSGFAGGIALLLLLVIQPDSAATSRTPLAAPEAIATLTLSPDPVAQPRSDGSTGTPRDQRAPVFEPAVFEPAVFEIALSRSERHRAPFPLRVTGPAGEDMRVILHDVPVAAWLSKGERRDEHTWALQLSDLKDLHLTLNEGTPDAFDMVMDVLGPAGTVAVPTVARVRLLDPPSDRRAAATIDDLLANPATAIGSAGRRKAVASDSGIDALLRADTRPAARAPSASEHKPVVKAAAQPRAPEERTAPMLAEAGGQAPQAARSRWPEGASALGAISREPGARQVWWTMPTAWAPFPDILGRP